MRLLFFADTFLPILCISMLTLSACKKPSVVQDSPMLVNTEHLDHLFEKAIDANGDTVGIIHIYSEAPDYQWIGDSDEGIACVDDAARAAIFYLRNYHYTGLDASREKAKSLLGFLLAMQASNGYFYNFIFADHTINRDGITSRAEPNWWSWRALWAIGEALTVLDRNEALFDRLITSRKELKEAILRDFPVSEDLKKGNISGVEVPLWMPDGSAVDQTALMVLGLSPILEDEETPQLERLVRSLLEGMTLMQISNQQKFPHGAFFSWQNTWHAYGNSQAYTLLHVAGKFNDLDLRKHALEEIDVFYPEWLRRNGPSHFTIEIRDGELQVIDLSIFPQIAYNLRPIIWSCLEAARITGEIRYLEMAQEVGDWFSGDNIAEAVMYDIDSGRGYDGINSEDVVNWNAGAESTIEALLALQELFYFDKSEDAPWQK